MTDPFFPQNPKAWKEVCTPAFDADELGKVDYVTINHSHFDHTANLPDLFKQARPTVICDRIFARELSAAFQVPEACIHPIVPGLTYHFDDFTLNTFSGNHTDLGTVSNFDGGKMFADPENPMIGPLNSYGCLYNTNYAFTLKNGFFIGFAAGVDLTDLQVADCFSGKELQRHRQNRMQKNVLHWEHSSSCQCIRMHPVQKTVI